MARGTKPSTCRKQIEERKLVEERHRKELLQGIQTYLPRLNYRQALAVHSAAMYSALWSSPGCADHRWQMWIDTYTGASTMRVIDEAGNVVEEFGDFPSPPPVRPRRRGASSPALRLVQAGER